ncbi:DNA repair protein RecN [Pasteurellaceae bacterium HPA106]|uniref:DNA repair protein RecN n=1 Tax=Spirabiliibacterium pneumoniae TaxID=221400 RepID=UPI001AACBB76|nr:DNA repair protein RecN [Spirabiliibacterium pneumoniae]MBE2895675.1 DNA repair protein RecN [Spirabiliibacterium pneumoniae]
MLIHLSVNQFAIVNHLELDLKCGMSVITGETGAGKSIAIDALGLCLGERCDSAMIRHGQERSDVRATFSVTDNQQAKIWLEEHELCDDEAPNQCTLRRVLRSDGRSKAFINNCPVPAAQLRELGQYLIQINGQHSTQRLLKNDYQLSLLDMFCHNEALLDDMNTAYQQWRGAKKALKSFQQARESKAAQKQLLEYQVNELDEFAPQEGEFESLEEQQSCLANSEQMTTLAQSALNLLSEGANNIESMLYKTGQYCDELAQISQHYAGLQRYLDDALIQVQEASSELSSLSSTIEQDPYLLVEVEQRMGQYIQLAKKHHIKPQALVQQHLMLKENLAQLTDLDENEEKLQSAVEQCAQLMQGCAQKLTQARCKGAKVLSDEINQLLSSLAMENAHFGVTLNDVPLSGLGGDEITFMLQANLGQTMQPLAKVASGGELSRIALALQALTADKHAIPTLIFDEIDTGISGATATTVGKLLHQLGQKCQVLCVTHLPQVAAFGDNHFSVEKFTHNSETITEMTALDDEQRVYALSKLLGGSSVTQTTLANAKELLQLAS